MRVATFFCLANVSDVLVQVIPSVAKRSGYFRFSLMPSVSTESFTRAVGVVLGEQKIFVPILVKNELPEKVVGLALDDIVRHSEDAISWASAQDIEIGLSNYCALPTDSKGAMPLRHLAALALAGDVETLKKYKRCFEQGDRLGFASYINDEMIGRAVLIASNV